MNIAKMDSKLSWEEATLQEPNIHWKASTPYGYITIALEIVNGDFCAYTQLPWDSRGYLNRCNLEEAKARCQDDYLNKLVLEESVSPTVDGMFEIDETLDMQHVALRLDTSLVKSLNDLAKDQGLVTHALIHKVLDGWVFSRLYTGKRYQKPMAYLGFNTVGKCHYLWHTGGKRFLRDLRAESTLTWNLEHYDDEQIISDLKPQYLARTGFELNEQELRAELIKYRAKMST